jgi:eukaryotic-like serine/threonine-protein kinase
MANYAVGPDTLVGQILGHYRIGEKIGAGVIGEVYRSHDEHFDREVAVKVVSLGILSNESPRESFCKEAPALSSPNHPNIARQMRRSQ